MAPRRKKPVLHDPVIVKGEIWYRGECYKRDNIRVDRKVARIAFGLERPTPAYLAAPGSWDKKIQDQRDSICIAAKGKFRTKEVHWSAGLDPKFFNVEEVHFIPRLILDPRNGRLSSYDGRSVTVLNPGYVAQQLSFQSETSP